MSTPNYMSLEEAQQLSNANNRNESIANRIARALAQAGEDAGHPVVMTPTQCAEAIGLERTSIMAPLTWAHNNGVLSRARFPVPIGGKDGPTTFRGYSYFLPVPASTSTKKASKASS